ncbi:ABC transporter substrate-binding protein [Streptomyces sp. T-3]|nr:ABC transporter substrate-binding protein [Streptomyces sp. T-3]
MTARRRTLPPRPRRTPKKTAAYAAATLAVCTSLTVGCGVIPGATGGSREPVVVMTWAPEKTRATNVPGVPAMAQAYARWVNANGGINGRELKVLTCNDHNDTVGAANCARRAVDEDVAAVVGSYSQHARSFLTPLEAAGIPYIGGYGVTDKEFASALSYPVNGGQPALMAGNGQQLAAHCKRIALVRPDSLAGDTLPEVLNTSLATAHRPPAADILAAEEDTDFTAQAEQALTKAGADKSLAATLGRAGAAQRAREGCVTAVLGDRTDTFFDSFRRTREDHQNVRISSVLGSVDQSLIDRTGGNSGPYEGAYVTGWYPVTGDQRWDPLRKVIKEHAFGDTRIEVTNAGVQTTWIAYTVLRKAIESLGDGEVTGTTIARTLDDGLQVDTGGLTPTLRWRFEDTIAAGDLPRLVNAHVTFQVVRDGRLVAAAENKGAVDVSRTLEQAD